MNLNSLPRRTALASNTGELIKQAHCLRSRSGHRKPILLRVKEKVQKEETACLPPEETPTLSIQAFLKDHCVFIVPMRPRGTEKKTP